MEITTSVGADSRAHLAISGEVDVSAAADVTAAGEQALAVPGCRGLVLELGQVSFLDSTGLGSLVSLRNAANAADGSFELHDVPEPVMRILQLTGMDSVFEVTAESA
jgi:anti-sigma B factor antagonist